MIAALPPVLEGTYIPHPHPHPIAPGWGLGGPLGFGGLSSYWSGLPLASTYQWTGLAYNSPSVQVLPALPGIPVQVIGGVTYQQLGSVLVQVVQ